LTRQRIKNSAPNRGFILCQAHALVETETSVNRRTWMWGMEHGTENGRGAQTCQANNL